jgi:hypothetical protein
MKYSTAGFSSEQRNQGWVHLWLVLSKATEITEKQIKSIFKFINHVRVHAALDREHGWSISFTLSEVAHFHHSSRKSWVVHEPNHTCADQAQYHTFKVWLHRDATKPLPRYAKAPATHDSYSSGQTITLPSGQHLSKGCYPKRTELYPCNPEPPVFLSDKVINTITHLINWLSQSQWTVVALFSWAVLHVLINL